MKNPYNSDRLLQNDPSNKYYLAFFVPLTGIFTIFAP